MGGLVAQVEIVIDTEASLQLLSSVASQFFRTRRQKRLQGMLRQKRLQKRRWLRLLDACKAGAKKVDCQRLIATN